MKAIPLHTLRELAGSVGLAVVSVTDVTELARDRAHVEQWQQAGYAGEMGYMRREAALMASPTRILPEARTVVSVGLSYDRRQREGLPVGYGRVARYAWGRDYHKVLRKRLERLCERVEEYLGSEIRHRFFSDSVPLLERALAHRGGMGFVGKNTMLIIPRMGSFLFLGEILWDVEVAELPEASPASRGGCGSCSRCMDSCPTQAFVSERVLDARRCISYLTIEKRGALSWEERAWLGDWVFGCDVCQEVCPFNVISLKTRAKPDVEELGQEFGVGQMLSLRDVLSIRADDAFVSRFAGTALMRAKREGLVRNAAVVAANTLSMDLLSELAQAAREDPSTVVRQHALWSHRVLSVNDGSRAQSQSDELLAWAEREGDVGMREEARQLRLLPLPKGVGQSRIGA